MREGAELRGRDGADTVGYSNPDEAEPEPHRYRDDVVDCSATGAGETGDSHVWGRSVYLLVKLQVGVRLIRPSHLNRFCEHPLDKKK